MFNNTKCIRYSKNPECWIKYHIGMNKYNEYWYQDLKNILKDYEFILIDSFALPMDNRDYTGIKFLKEFCDIMTVGNKVVVLDDEKFIRYLDTMNSNVYYDSCLNILTEMLSVIGFECINTGFEHSYLYKDIYIYRSILGLQVLDEIENYYGLVEDDLFWN